MDWIQGDKFVALADYTFAPKERSRDDYSHLPNTLNIKDAIWQDSSIKEVPIIYTHIMYVRELFDIMRFTHRMHILITHNGDESVHKDLEWDGHMTKWYSVNVNYQRDFIRSIPIGIENDRWMRSVNKKEKMLIKLTQPRKFKNLLYVNHNVQTNPAERQIPYNLFSGKNWVTIGRGVNGYRFDDYIDDIYNHWFVVCPQGNGIDTHRTWETLYMGSIPIEKRNINNQHYQNLPICFVDEWDEITPEFLENEYSRIKSQLWKMEMLTFEYWKNKILNGQ